MKKHLLLFLILTALIFSCKDHKSKNDSLNIAIKEFNQKYKSAEFTKVYPESYTEIITDTLMDNGFSIKIKNYSKTGKNDLVRADVTLKKYNKATQLRKFESEIDIYFEKNMIYHSIINAETFTMKENSDIWNNVTLQHAWVDQDSSTDYEVSLRLIFTNPLTNYFKLYEMKVDRDGETKIKLIEEHYS